MAHLCASVIFLTASALAGCVYYDESSDKAVAQAAIEPGGSVEAQIMHEQLVANGCRHEYGPAPAKAAGMHGYACPSNVSFTISVGESRCVGVVAYIPEESQDYAAAKILFQVAVRGLPEIPERNRGRVCS